MANKDPSKTEEATPKRIKKAREEGNVLSSGDVSSLALLLGGTLMMYAMAPMLSRAYADVMMRITMIDCRQNWTEQDIKSGCIYAMVLTAKVLAPTLIALCLCAVAVMRMQVGKYFSFTPLKWKFRGFDFQEIWSSLMPTRDTIVRLLMTIAKVALVGSIVYFTIKQELKEITQLSAIPLMEGIRWVLTSCLIMVFKILSLFLAIAVLDWIFRRKKYHENLMMSKQEVKDERRNSEGDPLIKSKIRHKMREILRSNMMKSVPQASVVVTNPVHVAVALRYEIGGAPPQVVAKGLRLRAERIKDLARLYNIPIVEAPPLARSIYRDIKVGGIISEQFYGAVASILAKLQRTGKIKLEKAKPRPQKRKAAGK